jgi:hypothetical protein
MFKKSLLAVSVASIVSMTANAGEISATVTETAAIETAVTAAIAAAFATTPKTSGCTAAAGILGVDVDLATFTNGIAATGTATEAGGVLPSIYDQVPNTVTMTSNDVCAVVVGTDVLNEASTTASSLEGAQANGAAVNASLVTGFGGYRLEDTIIITVTGGTIDELASASADLASTATAETTFDFAGFVGNTVRFTVGAISGGATAGPAREIAALTGLKVTPDSGVNDISISAKTVATTSLTSDESASKVTTTLQNQFTGSVVYLADGIIDVATDRQKFEATTGAEDSSGANETDILDTLALKVVQNTSVGNLEIQTATLEVTGEDFSWIESANVVPATAISSTEILTNFSLETFTDAALTTPVAGTAADSFTKAVVNSDYTKVTFTIGTGSDTLLDTYHKIGFKLDSNDETLVAQSYKASLTANDDGTGAGEAGSAVVATEVSVGSWTLNGSVVTIPYMPFDDNTAVILRHTNTGKQTGDITVRYMIEGVDSDWQELSTAVATSSKGLMDIRDDVFRDGIIAESGVTSGKVTVEITTNVPSDDVTVFAGFKVRDEKDRGIVGTFGALGSAQND